MNQAFIVSFWHIFGMFRYILWLIFPPAVLLTHGWFAQHNPCLEILTPSQCGFSSPSGILAFQGSLSLALPLNPLFVSSLQDKLTSPDVSSILSWFEEANRQLTHPPSHYS